MVNLPKPRRLNKYTYDNDYHSWTSTETISHPNQVKDNWSGESFRYSYINGDYLDVEEARKYLQEVDICLNQCL